MVLENDQTRSVMEFEHNTNLTLRNLIKNEGTFVKIVEKIVEINKNKGGAGQEINVLLLDKINKHKEVITEMTRLQRIEIETKLSNYFLLPGQDREEYLQHLQEPRKTIG